MAADKTPCLDWPATSIVGAIAATQGVGWPFTFAPGGPRGSFPLDAALADDFRALLAIDGDEARLTYLAQQVFADRSYWLDEPAGPRITVLRRWWLEIYEHSIGDRMAGAVNRGD